MQALLLNFGDNTRVVCDTKNNPLVIDIGRVVDADIHDLHFNMIRRAIKTDTLMVIPKGTRISEKLNSIIDVLRAVADEPYDTLLQRFNEVVPYDEDNGQRPTRDRIRMALVDLARYEVAKALHMQSQVFIHEQGDELTRKPPQQDDHSDGMLREILVEQPKAPEPAPEPAKPVAKKRAAKPALKTRKRERL